MDSTSSKVLSTTPFSINDILTRNNTSIFRRIPDAHDVEDMDEVRPKQLTGSSHEYSAAFHKYRQSESPRSESDEHYEKHLGKKSHSSGHSPVFYYNNNNLVANGGVYTRRGSLDCFLSESEIVKEKMESNYSSDGKLNGIDSKVEYYGTPGGETPLDMRRCTSNDSGEL